MNVLITDYIKNPKIEKKILGDFLVNNQYFNKNIKILLVWHQKINKDYLNQFPNLQAVVRYGVGYDQIDLSYCKKNNIAVCNTPDYGVNEVSDTALAMIMNITRGLNIYNNNAKKFFTTWQENYIKNLKRSSSCVVGIIGAGRIGSSLIYKLNSIGFKTCFYDPYVAVGYDKVINSIRYKSLDQLLGKSDILSFNCSLNKETKNILNQEFLNKVKTGVSIINTARGGLIENLDIIYDALMKKNIFCLGLDVLPEEPPKIDSKLIKLWKENPDLGARVLINPHTAFYSKQAFIDMRSKAAFNALNILTNNEYACRVV